MGAYAGLLWRQRLVLLGAVLLIAAVIATGRQLAPRNYTATAPLTWSGDPTLSLEPVDVASFSDDLLRDATATGLLTEVAAELSEHRSVARLREEITVVGDVDGGRVTVSVRDGDEETARQIAGDVASALPTYAQDLGIVPFVGGPATVTSSSVRPWVWVLGVLGIGLIWFLALLFAARRDRETNIATGAADIESALAAPVLAHLRMARDHTSLPALTPGAATADPIRHLRAALGLVGRVDHRVPAGAPAPALPRETKRLVVLSAPVRGHSQVWVGTNLALSLAQDGWSVLLVDGRLGPRFGAALPGEPRGAGLMEVLQGADVDDAMHPGPVAGLSVMSAGARTDPDGVLTERSFAAFVSQAQRHVDVVVVVTPALSVCDDALVMATPGSLLLTVPEGRVTLDSLRTLRTRVRGAKPRLLGSVLVGRLSERAHG